MLNHTALILLWLIKFALRIKCIYYDIVAKTESVSFSCVFNYRLNARWPKFYTFQMDCAFDIYNASGKRSHLETILLK